jgi:hypothetical protein
MSGVMINGSIGSRIGQPIDSRNVFEALKSARDLNLLIVAPKETVKHSTFGSGLAKVEPERGSEWRKIEGKRQKIDSRGNGKGGREIAGGREPKTGTGGKQVLFSRTFPD